MVIVGAGGFAKELLEVVLQTNPTREIAFYDDVTAAGPKLVFDQFPILKTQHELLAYFAQHGNNFVLGLGGGQNRKKLFDKISQWGGNLVSAIDTRATIGTFSHIGRGSTILSQACISNSAQIGNAALIYYHSKITHDCVLGDFVEISPGATLLGHVQIGELSQVGANATVLSHIKIGSNCLIGAGAVVTKDIPDNSIVAGVPGKIIRYKS
ncbi:acetyltransferase [Sphingobacterium thalpophilum]|uniref:acetyltransferase n=1 Tax=Sphingobacterium thalpophilum TaxID=259 RepID=UPI0031D7A26C